MAQSNAFNVVEATIDDIHAAYKSGQLTFRQLVQMYLDRIEAFDKKGPAINAIITINSDALKEADRLMRRTKLPARSVRCTGFP
jgi:Asp-tRNA(Asn)/Glu-tRNA(Gln) amidotransferase A subunit family amidase